ncbi:LexA family protein [Kallotenue papyrolyticum]|uniref:LexA family protein n=1 Tax=Kallotenue papyrolyticum TaxID=1325125 RepID=UPI001376D6A8|nr:hypothetical protein [Kallotenue papyrolyticum]
MTQSPMRRPHGSTRKRIHHYIQQTYQRTGLPLTVREVMAGAGLRSESSVCYHLRALSEQGVISMRPGVARSIRPVTAQDGREKAEQPAQTPIPAPGSPEATERGCRCPILDNRYGRGYLGDPGRFVMVAACPLHGLRRP